MKSDSVLLEMLTKLFVGRYQTLVDKQVKFQILSYKLGLAKSLTGLGLKKFKKPWAWACPNKFQPLLLIILYYSTYD
jgi:hypothetical protein